MKLRTFMPGDDCFDARWALLRDLFIEGSQDDEMLLADL